MAKEKLAQAFELSLDVADCSDETSRTTCRQIDTLMEEVLESIDSIFNGHVEEASKQCLNCDPRPQLWPMVDGVRVLTTLLRDKGNTGFTDSRQSLLEKLEIWKSYRCPCSDATTDAGRREVKRSREADARKEISSRCSERFATNRRGLVQVFRVPDDRRGCYQSRACRDATVYRGFQTQAGFWTYDGEYWYIWAERRGNSGEWITCEP